MQTAQTPNLRVGMHVSSSSYDILVPGVDANSPDSKPTRWPGKVTYHEVSPTHKPSNHVSKVTYEVSPTHKPSNHMSK